MAGPVASSAGFYALFGLCVIISMHQCVWADSGTSPSSTVDFKESLGPFTVTGSAETGVVAVAGAGGRIVWSTTPTRPWVSFAGGEFGVALTWGNAKVTDKVANRSVSVSVEAATPGKGELVLDGRVGFSSGGGMPFRATFSLLEAMAKTVQVQVSSPTDDALNRVFLTYASAADESFYGFGSQYTYFNLKGRKVPILVSEQGVGRGLQPVTAALDLFGHGAGGTWATTYGAVPHYLTSNNVSLYLTNSQYSTFDLSNADDVDVCVMAQPTTGLTVRIIDGDSLLDMVQEYTLYSGRQASLPKWVAGSGAILGAEGGTEAIVQKVEVMKQGNVPLAGLWVQDWSGLRTDSFGSRLWWNWEVDLDHYHHWTDLLHNLSTADPPVHMMTYVNPYLANNVDQKPNARRNLFAEAAQLGYLVKNSSGQPYIAASGSAAFTFGTVDVTNPDAVSWYADVIRCNMLLSGTHKGQPCDFGSGVAGVGGWMADFGEYLPFDAETASGVASEVHNRFPAGWAQLNANGVQAANRSGDATFFMRSASALSPASSTLFWMGDQLVTWDNFDGMASALTGMLSWGLSGMSLAHSDIGGYTMLNQAGGLLKYLRKKELLMRWIEMSAFSDAIFRTHPGNLPSQSWQVDSDNETLAQFATFARVHAALWTYREVVMAEVGSAGAPHTRHTMLHFQSDPDAQVANSQFLVGPQVLVAPVLTEGATSVAVYLPHGSWTHVWTNQTHIGPANLTVPAPLGQPGVFVRGPQSSEYDSFTAAKLVSTICAAAHVACESR